MDSLLNDGRRNIVVIGVVPSGSLDDGTAGLWHIKDRKGLAFAQDPEQAAYSSMPDSAIGNVDTDFVGSIDELAARIASEVAQDLLLPIAGPPRHSLQVETTVALGDNAMQNGVLELGHASKYTCPAPSRSASLCANWCSIPTFLPRTEARIEPIQVAWHR